ncbi:MAG: DUF4832 domain-containing protein, partial [Flavobacterium sp.]
GFRTQSCFNDIENHLGYRFEMNSGIFPTTAAVGGTMPVTLKITNTGFASPFNPRKTYVVLRNTSSGVEYSVQMTTDPRFWTPNALTTITENLQLPATMAPGSYKLYLKLPDNDAALALRPEYSIRMANENTWDAVKGMNDLKHTITIGATSKMAIAAAAAPKINIALYPVPTSESLTIEADGIRNMDISVSNSLGQSVTAEITSSDQSSASLNTAQLSDGVYFVSISGNGTRETRRFVVSH